MFTIPLNWSDAYSTNKKHEREEACTAFTNEAISHTDDESSELNYKQESAEKNETALLYFN